MRHIILAALLAAVMHGSITYYSPNVMEAVYKNRLAWGHVEPCKTCVGKIAVLDRQYLGQHAYLKVRGAWFGPFLVVDVAADCDRERLRKRGLIAELEYRWAQRLGFAGVGPLQGVTLFVMEDHKQ